MKLMMNNVPKNFICNARINCSGSRDEVLSDELIINKRCGCIFCLIDILYPIIGEDKIDNYTLGPAFIPNEKFEHLKTKFFGVWKINED